jgi:transcription initiation factor TFIID subunit 5
MLRQEAKLREFATQEVDDDSIANFVLFYNEDEANNPKAYDQSYSRLVKWVDDSIDIYKVWRSNGSWNCAEYSTLYSYMLIWI